ncbi:MAG: lactate racemase domain-containing protein [Gemmataceae bacterium]
MQVGIPFGRDRLELDIHPDQVVPVERQTPAPALANVSAAVSEGLEIPEEYPALRRALTPDDHVAIVVDEALPRVAELLSPILGHIASAGVRPDAITLLCPASASRQEWIEQLPEAFEEVRLEVHDANDRKKLAYLATTKQGRRIYLNRTAVDADQLVLLAGRRYDPLVGVSGCESALYPLLADKATREESWTHLSPAAPEEADWPVSKEATEVAWLVGAPFVVQVVEGAGDSVAHVVCGSTQAGRQARRLLDAHWRISVPERADLVIAGVSGTPAWHSFADLGHALACAARVVRPDGRIILLSQATHALEHGAELMRQAEDPQQALALLKQNKPPDMSAAYQWLLAAQQARIYLLSGLPGETAEELFTVPLESAAQVQRLIGPSDKVLFLEDAHKMLALVK